MGLFLLWFFFGIGVVIQLVYLLVIFGRTAWFKSIRKSSKNQIPEEGVTVLVAAHNEFQNLKVLIPKLFEQDYPKFDVMIVNDRSTDRTKRLLEEMMGIYPKLRSVTIKYTPNHVTPKKFALTLGIKVSKNDVILLTDADCMPTNNQWIRKMTEPIREDGKTFSIGFSGYAVKSSLLNKWIQFETMLTALFYFSFGLWKAPFMGVGRNLCYRRSFFMEVKAFRGLWHLEGGDDDLFVNQYATGKNSAIVIDPDAVTTSIPKETWKEYLVQKKRHLNAGQYYRGEDKRKIGLFSLSHALYWIGAIGLMIYFGVGTELEQFLIVLGIVSVRSFLVLNIFSSASKKIQGFTAPMNVLINDFIYLGYFWVLGSVSYQAKDIPWK
jgi:cellulose synthase/poly-beta-1,6-N-acetylglucosamine synthase-like glycosyltransferase